MLKLLSLYHTYILLVIICVILIIVKRLKKGRFKLRLITQLEYIFLIIPGVIIGILVYLRLPHLYCITSTILKDIITIIAYQWYWVMRDGEIYIYNISLSYIIESGEIYLSSNSFIRITGRANDVIHRIYIPSLYFKIDLIPGRTTSTSLEVERITNYGVCAEICGANHAFIPFKYSIVHSI